MRPIFAPWLVCVLSLTFSRTFRGILVFAILLKYGQRMLAMMPDSSKFGQGFYHVNYKSAPFLFASKFPFVVSSETGFLQNKLLMSSERIKTLEKTSSLLQIKCFWIKCFNEVIAGQSAKYTGGKIKTFKNSDHRWKCRTDRRTNRWYDAKKWCC